MSVVAINHVSLDGVLQGPGRPDEDTRDGFRHGGWAALGDDPTVPSRMGERMGPGFAWLFGRRSYDDMLTHWNAVGGPFKDGLNATMKYVATTGPAEQLTWPNTAAVGGDVPAEVARLRDRHDGNLVIMGSGELIRALLPHELVDELLLFVHPVVLGSGRRLFGPDPEPRRWRLRSSEATASGVLVANYEIVRRTSQSAVDDRSVVGPPG